MSLSKFCETDTQNDASQRTWIDERGLKYDVEEVKH